MRTSRLVCGVVTVLSALCVAGCGSASGGGEPKGDAGRGTAGEPAEEGSEAGGGSGQAGDLGAEGGAAAAGGQKQAAGGAGRGGGAGRTGVGAAGGQTGEPGGAAGSPAEGGASRGGASGLGGDSGGAGEGLGGDGLEEGGAAAGGDVGTGGTGAGGEHLGQGGMPEPDPIPVVDKLDLLLVIDNSISMLDKQTLLAGALPQLLGRLTNPDCVSSTDPSAEPQPAPTPQAACPPGFERQFTPMQDIHLGIVTSSMGDNGGNFCPEVTADKPENAQQNDRGWLVGALGAERTGLTTTEEFLAWTPTDQEDHTAALVNKGTLFQSFVQAAGTIGCGLEMPLEAWYRFLADPLPPLTVDLAIPGDTRSNTVRSSVTDPVGGVDANILAQRAAFLRPDSLLVVGMLSDENDCSLKDSGIAFLPATTATMRRGTSICETDPNSPCCYSCYFDTDTARPAGCTADEVCSDTNGSGVLAATEDYSGHRCYDQKRRFGFDFLMPTARYVNALTRSELCLDNDALACTSEEEDAVAYAAQASSRHPNPLFSGEAGAGTTGTLRRSSNQVFLMGIVGVPWQDLATEESLEEDVPLTYRQVQEIDWALILPAGDGTPPSDPLMIESIEPRTGTHPITGDAVAPPESTTLANSINGHEWYPTGDLQSACMFDLRKLVTDEPNPFGLEGAVRDCTDTCTEGDTVCARELQGCACTVKDDPATGRNPVCQEPETGNYGTIQYGAKAYPSHRQLMTLRDYAKASSGGNSIVASACPKDLSWENRTTRSYGYNPAVQALLERLSSRLGGH